jgi:N-acetylmuramoyl-L-alanine amidase
VPLRFVLAALLGVAQLAAGPGLTVRARGRVITVPIVGDGSTASVSASALAAALGGAVRRTASGAYHVSLPGAEFDVVTRGRGAVVDGDSVTLAAVPYLRGEALYVPLQLASELLPRYGSGVIFDPAHRELRTFAGGAAVSRTVRTVRTVRTAPSAAPPREVAAEPIAGASPTAARASASRRTRRYKVVVDAGHGGPDHGMNGPIGGGPRVIEKDITLAVARKLADALRARGIDVLMTRTTDTLIALSDRGRIANQSRADLFLSVHVNAANPGWTNPGAARGFETYFLAEAKTEDARRVEQMENEAVRFETGATAQRGDPLSFIINDMAQNEHLRESSELASAIQRGLGSVHPAPSRGVKQANFAVLRTSFMPAVLVEIGFGTNSSDAAFIVDDAHEREIANAVAAATDAYLGRYERRVGGAAR